MISPKYWAEKNCPHKSFTSIGDCIKRNCPEVARYKNGNAYGCKLHLEYAKDLTAHTNHVEKCCNCQNQSTCAFSSEMDHWRPYYSCKGFKHIRKNTVYIIRPICHGNGGWCGSEVVSEHRGLKAALRTKPRWWREEHSPYSGHVFNHPRLSRTTEINEALYYFTRDDDACGKWVKIRDN